MTTRSMAKALELDSKLRSALDQLKTNQALCDKLLAEREDSEIELQKILNKNKELKNELSEYDIKYHDILDQRDRLQNTISTYDQCNDLYEQALDRVRHLERELSAAQGRVEQLEAEKHQRQLMDTQTLYDELVGQKSRPFVGICTSRNKCKKIARINRLVRNATFQITKYCYKCRTTDKLRAERMDLLTQLEKYSVQLANNKINYDMHTRNLESEIIRLTDCLTEIKYKYDQAEKQIDEHVLATDKLLELCRYNSERFDSLVNNHQCDCGRPARTELPTIGATDKIVAEVIVKELKMPISAAQFELQLTDLARRTLLGAPLTKGAERLLTHLYDNKIPMALATNSTEQAVRLQSTARPKLFGMFHHKVSITDPEVYRGKPYPDIYLVAASRFPDKPKPQKCLVFEDSPRGVQAAREAGMQVVMTPEGRLDREKTRLATLVLPSLKEFKPELFGLPPFDDPPPKPLTKKPRKTSMLGDEALGDKAKKESKKPA